MDIIPEELVEETWEETSGFSPEKAHEEITVLSRKQPNLMAFIAEFTQDLEQEAAGLGMYIFYNIYRMFEKNSSDKIIEIPLEDIEDSYDYNESLIESLDGAHERFHDRIARVQLSRQPFVMKYVVESLMEAPDDEEDPVDLSEDETGYLFLILKTVVDLLNKVT